jgi:hypothetical protein
MSAKESEDDVVSEDGDDNVVVFESRICIVSVVQGTVRCTSGSLFFGTTY